MASASISCSKEWTKALQPHDQLISYDEVKGTTGIFEKLPLSFKVRSGSF